MKATRILVPMPAELVAEIDKAQKREKISSRSEAIRLMLWRSVGVELRPFVHARWMDVSPETVAAAIAATKPEAVGTGEPCAAQPPKPLKKLPLPPRRL